MEQHYSVKSLAKMWGWSYNTVRPWFEGVPGCMVEAHPEKMHKRGYTSIRIPHSIALRVYAEHLG